MHIYSVSRCALLKKIYICFWVFTFSPKRWICIEYHHRYIVLLYGTWVPTSYLVPSVLFRRANRPTPPFGPEAHRPGPPTEEVERQLPSSPHPPTISLRFQTPSARSPPPLPPPTPPVRSLSLPPPSPGAPPCRVPSACPSISPRRTAAQRCVPSSRPQTQRAARPRPRRSAGAASPSCACRS